MTETNRPSDTAAPSDAAMTLEFTDALTEMRRTLATAPLFAIYTAARVAIQVRTDADAVLNHLEQTSEGFYNDASDEQIGREGVIVQLKIKSWLTSRRDTSRTVEARLAGLRERAQRAERLLGPDDDQVRSFWESLYLEQARNSQQFDDAKAAYRDLLTARQYQFPEPDVLLWSPPMNFRLSLSSQNFATILRRSSDPADAKLGERITAYNAKWRRGQYGSRHPFTMVAEANRLIDALYRAEALHDSDEPIDSAHAATRSLHSAALALAAARREVLGEHHGASVKAQSYTARALRLLGEPLRARAVAEDALAHYSAYARSDDTVRATLQFIAAEGYAQEAADAHENMLIARAAGTEFVADAERDRARGLWQRASELAETAEQHIRRWSEQSVWLPRVAALHARRDRAGYADRNLED